MIFFLFFFNHSRKPFRPIRLAKCNFISYDPDKETT